MMSEEDAAVMAVRFLRAFPSATLGNMAELRDLFLNVQRETAEVCFGLALKHGSTGAIGTKRHASARIREAFGLEGK